MTLWTPDISEWSVATVGFIPMHGAALLNQEVTRQAAIIAYIVTCVLICSSAPVMEIPMALPRLRIRL